MELMELENIVANTVYLKAREGGPDNSKGRSKKWRKLMTFPHISQCLYLKDHLPSLEYSYLVDEQPLGAKLFRQFCEAHKKEYYQYNEFLDAVETYEIELEEARAKSAAIVFKKYLTRPDTSDSGVDTCENEVLFTFTIQNFAFRSSVILKAKERIGVTFNFNEQDIIDFMKFSKMTVCRASEANSEK